MNGTVTAAAEAWLKSTLNCALRPSAVWKPAVLASKSVPATATVTVAGSEAAMVREKSTAVRLMTPASWPAAEAKATVTVSAPSLSWSSVRLSVKTLAAWPGVSAKASPCATDQSSASTVSESPPPTVYITVAPAAGMPPVAVSVKVCAPPSLTAPLAGAVRVMLKVSGSEALMARLVRRKSVADNCAMAAGAALLKVKS